jgi:outer membrane protein assembly factor BamB
MGMTPRQGPTSGTPLRLWPGVVAAALLVLVGTGLPIVFPEGQSLAIAGRLLLALVIFAWWVFFSRVPWLERLAMIVLMVVALFATSRVVHESIRNGMMGMMLVISAVPVLSVALVIGAAASRRLGTGPRRLAIAASILAASGMWTMLRTDGITGSGASQLAWRWTPTAEERLLALERESPLDLVRNQAATSSPALASPATPVDSPPESGGDAPVDSAPAGPARPLAAPDAAIPPRERATDPADAVRDSVEDEAAVASVPAARADVGWPGFRGPGRDSVVRGVRIGTNWTTSPPVELWRRPIGPGWSSFAVQDTFLYTQEQRGDEEVVACYDATTGEPVWMHRNTARFWESNGGPGPRATPTLSSGRVYTLGATGILNALDARTGAVFWSRNAVEDTGANIPGWGIAGSPIVVSDLVIVAAAGRLAAYDLITGEPRWIGSVGRGGYSSPQLVTIDGVEQVVLLSGSGVTGVAPADGTVLWQHAWPGDPILQPAVLDSGDVLVSTTGSTGVLGMRRLEIAREPAGWTVAERWTSNGLKPFFNDFVVHDGHVYGFDGFILASIDLEDGTRMWKGGRYGNGQLVLLPEQDLLLVLSEEGDLALVRATPDRFTEVARHPAIDGKTWNHPVLVGDLLLVRNGQEMAAFRLPVEGH